METPRKKKERHRPKLRVTSSGVLYTTVEDLMADHDVRDTIRKTGDVMREVRKRLRQEKEHDDA